MTERTCCMEGCELREVLGKKSTDVDRQEKKLKCGHIFHRKCFNDMVDEFYERHTFHDLPQCPECRKNGRVIKITQPYFQKSIKDKIRDCQNEGEKGDQEEDEDDNEEAEEEDEEAEEEDEEAEEEDGEEEDEDNEQDDEATNVENEDEDEEDENADDDDVDTDAGEGRKRIEVDWTGIDAEEEKKSKEKKKSQGKKTTKKKSQGKKTNDKKTQERKKSQEKKTTTRIGKRIALSNNLENITKDIKDHSERILIFFTTLLMYSLFGIACIFVVSLSMLFLFPIVFLTLKNVIPLIIRLLSMIISMLERVV
jgi:hypothetical protein